MLDTTLSAAVPIIVGVAGHRDLVASDLPTIRSKIYEALDSLERLAPQSPKLLLSALAEGADQLVAELALERGWQVVCVPPMPLVDFIEDFKTVEARQRFHGLLNRCVALREADASKHLDPQVSSQRDHCYRDQGTYLARQAQVVIVLWDGRPSSPGACGTSWVVDVCRNGPPPADGTLLSAPETTGLIHIPVRRGNLPDVKPIVGDVVPSDKAFRRVLAEIDWFNRVANRARNTRRIEIEKSSNWVIDDDTKATLDPGTVYVLERFAEADALAIQYQANRKRTIIAVSLMTVIAAFSQATNSVFKSHPWLIAYGLALGLAYVSYLLCFRLPRFKIEDRFLEYRALAEAARVQFFWRLSGLPNSVAEHYLQLVKSEVGWVREAVRAIGFHAVLLNPAPIARSELVRDRWLADQVKYFFGTGTAEKPGNIAKRKLWQQRSERSSMLFFGLGALLVALAGVADYFPLFAGLKDMASVYSASFFLVAAVIKGVAATMVYAEEVASFEKSGAVFRNALSYFDNNDNEGQRESCILELGKHALAENADWLLQHRRNAFKIEK